MLYGTAEDTEPGTGDDGIVLEATERWKACKDWQGKQDEAIRGDIKFANADSRNAWAWPDKIYEARTGGETELPCLTINNTRVHNDIIINSLSKNGYGIRVRPTGGKASYKSAEVMQALIRRIEYISKASATYRKVTEQQVDGGIGYVLIETAYVSSRTRNQEIYLKASRDPTGVYLDPWIRETDGSDANFGFVFEKMPRKEFNRKYKRFKNKVGTKPLDTGFAGWLSDKEIMLVKYFRKKANPDTLLWWKQDNGDEVEKLGSEIRKESGKELYEGLLKQIEDGDIEGGTRKVFDDQVEWFLIAGDTVIERGKWAGKYIPICRCVGRELVIDGTLDLKGHTRPLIDANRMLNYNASCAVQVVATQTKTQWLAPARSIEGQEQWKTANVETATVLLWNDIDDEAAAGNQAVEKPERIEPPTPSPGHMQGMQDAERQMMMISGQFQAQMGENDTQSAASGKAINERKEQGDTATYHFVEHRADMLRFLGVQLLDLIPKIYDTERTLHILDEDGEKRWIQINPNQSEVVLELAHEKEDEEAVQLAFNPSIGEYECVSDPGPDYATQRQQAYEAMERMLGANTELISTAGDLLFKYADFPGADKIQERLQKEIKAQKPYLFDDQINPQLQAAQEQNKRLVQLNAELMQKIAEMHLAQKGREEKRDVDAFNAETNRMKAQIEALTKLLLSPQQKAQMEHELESQSREHVFNLVEAANAADLAPDQGDGSSGGQQANGGQVKGNALPPMDGARQAKDGMWYVPDKMPGREGKYMRVIH